MIKKNRSHKKFIPVRPCECCRENANVGFIIDAKSTRRVQKSKRDRTK